MKRKGHVTRIHDFGPFKIGPHTFNLVISCVGEWYCNGSHKWPTVTIYLGWLKPRKDMTNWSASCTHVKTTKRFNIYLPYVKWHVGYRYRHTLPFLRWLNRGFDKLYRWAFVTTYKNGIHPLRAYGRYLDKQYENSSWANSDSWKDRK